MKKPWSELYRELVFLNNMSFSIMLLLDCITFKVKFPYMPILCQKWAMSLSDAAMIRNIR